MSVETLPCPRTFALYKPGEFLPGVMHSAAYTGSMPNTGRLLCYLCGADVAALNKIVQQVTERLKS